MTYPRSEVFRQRWHGLPLRAEVYVRGPRAADLENVAVQGPDGLDLFEEFADDTREAIIRDMGYLLEGFLAELEDDAADTRYARMRDGRAQ